MTDDDSFKNVNYWCVYVHVGAADVGFGFVLVLCAGVSTALDFFGVLFFGALAYASFPPCFATGRFGRLSFDVAPRLCIIFILLFEISPRPVFGIRTTL